MDNLRLAVVMVQSAVGQIEQNLAAVRYWTHRARQAKARLVCFPEMVLTGYSTRGSLAGCALPPDGAIAAELEQMAAQEAITILVGAAEPALEDRVYAAHWVVHPGMPIAVYRKTHIAPPEAETFVPGNRVPVFDSGDLRFGIQLCYDAHFPELSAHMASQGADILFFPHASPRGTPEEKLNSWMRHLTARAFDNGVFVVACNQAGENGEGLFFPGTAVIIGPLGDVLAQDTSGEEGLLLTDLEASRLAHVRGHRMRHFLPYRRPRLYRRLLSDQCDQRSDFEK